MRVLFTILFLNLLLFSSDTTICKSCHPDIYREYQSSMHKNSTIKLDKVHKAVWNLHPAKKRDNYKCASCHSPQKDEGVTCITCHSIKSIEKHTQKNRNIYETKPKTFFSAQKGMEDKKVVYKEKESFFGLLKSKEGSPYHDIDYTNKNFYDANMCMGCHSHKQNKKSFTICTASDKSISSKKQNCITCHMPQVIGSATTIKKTKTHAYHGFLGVYNKPNLLAKYIEMDLKNSKDSFVVTLKSKVPHDFLTHPLRVLTLKVSVKRENKEIFSKSIEFYKLLGHGKKPSMPWEADMMLKDTVLKPDEKRDISFRYSLKPKDRVKVTFGFYRINPKVAKKLSLEKQKDITKLYILKERYFKID